MADQDKWGKLRQWVAKRHDYFEREYGANQVAVDEVEAAAYRKVFEAMMSFEEQESRLKYQPQGRAPKARPTEPPKADS